MSVKSVIKPYLVLSAGDMSGSLTTLATNISSSDNIGYQVDFTGVPNGTFSVEGTINGTTWQGLTLTPAAPVAAGAAGGFVVNLNQVPYEQIRLVYTRTSGTGSLTVWAMSKRLGG